MSAIIFLQIACESFLAKSAGAYRNLYEAIGIRMSRGSQARLETFAHSARSGKLPVDAARIAKYPNDSAFASNARKRAGRIDVKARVLGLVLAQ
jgi:hypothetical protein